MEATSSVPAWSDGPSQESGIGQATVTYPSGFEVPHAALPEDITPPVQLPTTTPAMSAPFTEVMPASSQSASAAAYWPPTLTGPPLDLVAWVEMENLLASLPSWKPLTEVVQEEWNQPLSTDPADRLNCAPETLESTAGEQIKLEVCTEPEQASWR